MEVIPLQRLFLPVMVTMKPILPLFMKPGNVMNMPSLDYWEQHLSIHLVTMVWPEMEVNVLILLLISTTMEHLANSILVSQVLVHTFCLLAPPKSILVLRYCNQKGLVSKSSILEEDFPTSFQCHRTKSRQYRAILQIIILLIRQLNTTTRALLEAFPM